MDEHGPPFRSALTSEQILAALGALSGELGTRGITGEICLFGGTVMVLAFAARLSTKDVDALFQPADTIRELAQRIAEDQQLPDNWLNDGVKGFVSARHDVTAGNLPQFPNLRLTMPVAEYMLAMKCMAARLGYGGWVLHQKRLRWTCPSFQRRGSSRSERGGLSSREATFFGENRVSRRGLVRGREDMRAKSLKEVAELAAQGEPFDPCFLGFLDAFYAAPAEASLAQAPPLLAPQFGEIGRVRDAYLAAAAEELARAYRFQMPSWTAGDARQLHHPWFASPLAALRAVLLLESPPAFRSRNLFVSGNALNRA